MVETIRANLFRNFGYPRFDDGLAAAAFENLRRWLTEPDGSTHLWFATTNYDACIEVAFSSKGFDIEDGFTRPSFGATPVLDPLGLAERSLQSTGILPVLHLHGAVGWYRDQTGVIRRHANDQPYNQTLGSPALLLPDATKTVDSLTGAERLWDEFRLLIDQATHVFILGHSLNDRHLLDLLRRGDKPIAVATFAPDGAFGDQDAARIAQDHVASLLPNAVTIACDFGPSGHIDESRVAKWFDGRL
jgi:hypothetical protein